MAAQSIELMPREEFIEKILGWFTPAQGALRDAGSNTRNCTRPDAWDW